jgi:lipoyl(octanoyl) transferase
MSELASELPKVREHAQTLSVCQMQGFTDYQACWEAMQAYTRERGPEDPDQLWLVQHQPVFTLGKAGKPEHVLAAGDIPVIKVDRGGQVTFHGPGQIVAYPMLDLHRLGIGIRSLVTLIEQAIIDTLADYGQSTERLDGAPGVYHPQGKIAALGLRVSRGCTFHGLAFNVDMDLSPYHRINPCGYAGMAVTDCRRTGIDASFDAIQQRLVEHLAQLLNYPHTTNSNRWDLAVEP